MPPFYTRSGDDGTTGILGQGRLPKHHPRLETVGSLDEASAALGLARAACHDRQTADWLAEAQRDLYVLMAEVSATPENAARFPGLPPERLAWLEARIQELEAQVELPREFILPGDSAAGAALSLARTIVRRAERRLAEWIDSGGNASTGSLQYLNRLSSLLFVLELWENQAAGKTTSPARRE
jgi:cob(I)alamin adenosyltransferase